ncbi:MAG: hypothetical protein CM15mP74_03400 [Halieaceae bacterium]|nr:MAG: hypothetical protein CM15mP74_03400 [Halieaceae bacterium]
MVRLSESLSTEKYTTTLAKKLGIKRWSNSLKCRRHHCGWRNRRQHGWATVDRELLQGGTDAQYVVPKIVDFIGGGTGKEESSQCKGAAPVINLTFIKRARITDALRSLKYV